MPVTTEELTAMQTQLESDRETCANSPLAQKYLDGCEQIQNALALEVGQKLIGTDDADQAELESMVKDLNQWQEAFDAIPPSEQSSASYIFAQECLRILKRNYVALYRKNRLAALVSAEAMYQDGAINDSER